MTEEKKKVKVYKLKIGNLLLVFKRKLRKDETLIPQTRSQLLAADGYQSQFFGYKKLGAKSFFMSKARLVEYLEKKFSQQDEFAKARFVKLIQKQRSHRERILRAKSK